jgi:outer membrane immunogenic protein
MKKYLLSTTCAVVLLGGVSAANAADMAVKAAPSAPAYNLWTGPYLGAHVGIARMNSDCNMLGPYNYYSCGYSAETGSLVTRDTSIAGGVQGGYDWQDGSFVYGVVADWTWTGLKHSQSLQQSFGFKAQVDWLASFRGRMGLAVDRTLVYVTGGLALGGVKAQGLGGAACDCNGYVYSPLNKVAVGWVAGAGVEHQIRSMPRWSVNGEVLYYDLGRQSGDVTSWSGKSYQNEYSFEVFEARIGLNYRF